MKIDIPKMKNFVLLIIISFIALINISNIQVDKYKNQPYSEINIGDTLNIYYSTNSCCFYCLTNQNEINHLEVIEDNLIVEKSKKNCIGCNSTYAFQIVGKNKGIDTLRINSFSASEECIDGLDSFEQYVIKVK